MVEAAVRSSIGRAAASNSPRVVCCGFPVLCGPHPDAVCVRRVSAAISTRLFLGRGLQAGATLSEMRWYPLEKVKGDWASGEAPALRLAVCLEAPLRERVAAPAPVGSDEEGPGVTVALEGEDVGVGGDLSIPAEQFEFRAKIGQGSFGVVYRACGGAVRREEPFWD